VVASCRENCGSTCGSASPPGMSRYEKSEIPGEDPKKQALAGLPPTRGLQLTLQLTQAEKARGGENSLLSHASTCPVPWALRTEALPLQNTESSCPCRESPKPFRKIRSLRGFLITVFWGAHAVEPKGREREAQRGGAVARPPPSP